MQAPCQLPIIQFVTCHASDSSSLNPPMFTISNDNLAELYDWCENFVGRANWGIQMSTQWGQVHVRIDDPIARTIAILKFT